MSNIGTWVQRTAQDWLVLTQLTHHNATSLGVVMALQFGPHIVLLPFTGSAADRFDRRRILVATQSAMFVLALTLGLLTLFGAVALWHVYAFALLLGCVTAFDAPAARPSCRSWWATATCPTPSGSTPRRSTSARMVGPAIAGVLLASVGTGWAFMVNALSYLAVLAALWRLRMHVRHASPRARRRRGRASSKACATCASGPTCGPSSGCCS